MIDNEEYFNEDLVDNLLDEDEITTDTGELYEHFSLILAVIVSKKLLKLVAFMLMGRQ